MIRLYQVNDTKNVIDQCLSKYRFNNEDMVLLMGDLNIDSKNISNSVTFLSKIKNKELSEVF